MASESGCPIEMHKIPIEKCDEMYDEECTGDKFMPFHRAGYDKKTGQSPNTPREQQNSMTSWIDASFVYSTKVIKWCLPTWFKMASPQRYLRWRLSPLDLKWSLPFGLSLMVIPLLRCKHFSKLFTKRFFTKFFLNWFLKSFFFWNLSCTLCMDAVATRFRTSGNWKRKFIGKN